MKKFLFIFIALSLPVFVTFQFIVKKPAPEKITPPLLVSTLPISSPVATARRKSMAAAGRQVYSISASHNSPELFKAIIDPEDVKVGQRQTMTVYIKDEKAPITEVVAEIQTDKEILKHPLTRISGTDTDGVWESSWIVHDTHETTYVTVFKAKNSLGETGDARISWTDPGCGCSAADCTISTTCTVSGDEGANGGILTITGSVTVPNATYLTYGATLNISGSLAMNDGGVLKSGSICGGVSDGVACTLNGGASGQCASASCASGNINYASATHTAAQCTTAGGTVVTIAGDANGTEVCRFNSASCVAGWAQAGNWSTTTASTCNLQQRNGCGDAGCGCNTLQSTSRSSGSHTWANTALESGGTSETTCSGVIYCNDNPCWNNGCTPSISNCGDGYAFNSGGPGCTACSPTSCSYAAASRTQIGCK